ncbi:HAD family hydrolase [Micromonospora sp. U21]|nr:HAD family hydrolase [Micromonospora sp. U21]
MVIDHAVWDMDGTLIDSARAVPEAFVRAVGVLNGPTVNIDDVIAAYWRGTPEVILAHLVGRELRLSEHDTYYRELDGVQVNAYPGVLATLGALRTGGLPIVVFTGASTRAARILLGAAGLEADIIIGGDRVENPKPAPDGMRLAAKLLDTTPERLLLIGDSPLDLRAAKAAGSFSAAAAWGHMHDPAEPADVTLPTPEDLLPLLRAVTPGD